jgi:hypothetical protein
MRVFLASSWFTYFLFFVWRESWERREERDMGEERRERCVEHK